MTHTVKVFTLFEGLFMSEGLGVQLWRRDVGITQASYHAAFSIMLICILTATGALSRTAV